MIDLIRIVFIEDFASLWILPEGFIQSDENDQRPMFEQSLFQFFNRGNFVRIGVNIIPRDGSKWVTLWRLIELLLPDEVPIIYRATVIIYLRYRNAVSDKILERISRPAASAISLLACAIEHILHGDADLCESHFSAFALGQSNRFIPVLIFHQTAFKSLRSREG
ncbi:MAG TPA: hypothetical protein VID27_20340, partial [Blastocatellia bacterium]